MPHHNYETMVFYTNQAPQALNWQKEGNFRTFFVGTLTKRACRHLSLQRMSSYPSVQPDVFNRAKANVADEKSRTPDYRCERHRNRVSVKIENFFPNMMLWNFLISATNFLEAYKWNSSAVGEVCSPSWILLDNICHRTQRNFRLPKIRQMKPICNENR